MRPAGGDGGLRVVIDQLLYDRGCKVIPGCFQRVGVLDVLSASTCDGLALLILRARRVGIAGRGICLAVEHVREHYATDGRNREMLMILAIYYVAKSPLHCDYRNIRYLLMQRILAFCTVS